MKKTYTNGEVTVIWQPDLCIHSTICFKGLPAVFRPRERPWVRPEAADTARIIEQVKRCPSGALSYQLNAGNEAPSNQQSPDNQHPVVISVTPNGPLLVQGPVSLTEAGGPPTHHEGPVALCRCGASGRKPFCDGSHVRIDFRG